MYTHVSIHAHITRGYVHIYSAKTKTASTSILPVSLVRVQSAPKLPDVIFAEDLSVKMWQEMSNVCNFQVINNQA